MAQKILYFVVILWTNIHVIRGKTQSNVIDDCPTCLGATCPATVIVFNATGAKDHLSSPSFPRNYPDNELCRWMFVTAYPWQVVRVEVTEMHIRSSGICKEDFLYLQDGGRLYSKYLMLCCQERCKGRTFTSTGQEMRLTFSSDGYRNDVGFNLTYWAVPKNSKIVKSPHFSYVNYLLFLLFVGIVLSITLTSSIIICLRRKTGRSKQEYYWQYIKRIPGNFNDGSESTADKLADSDSDSEPPDPAAIRAAIANRRRSSTLVASGVITEAMLKRRSHVRKTRLDKAMFNEPKNGHTSIVTQNYGQDGLLDLSPSFTLVNT